MAQWKIFLKMVMHGVCLTDFSLTADGVVVATMFKMLSDSNAHSTGDRSRQALQCDSTSGGSSGEVALRAVSGCVAGERMVMGR